MVALFAGVVMASCSDDRSNEPSAGPDTSGSGYVSIAIGMPKAAISRAANDNFDDGLEEEYNVNSLSILFFTGNTESDAKFYQAYNLTGYLPADAGNETPQISAIKKVTFPVDIAASSESLWALAIVNHGSVINVDESGGVTLTDKVNGALSGKFSISDFMKLTTETDLYSLANNGTFFMTNTPYSTAPGSGNSPTGGSVHFLAFVDKGKIMKTIADAENNPAAEIFVERAVAKVEVKAKISDVDVSALPDTEIEKIEWLIDNTEPSTYLARNLHPAGTKGVTDAPDWLDYTTSNLSVNSSAAFRFVGSTVFSSISEKKMYRIYFGVDPNNKGIDADKSLNVMDETNVTFGSTDAAQYCYENTFDAAHQDYRNTTRAVLKVTFKGGEFYTRGLDRSTRYTLETAASVISQFVMENNDVISAWNNSIDKPTGITNENLVVDKEKMTASTEWFELSMKVKDGNLVLSDVKLLNGNGTSVPVNSAGVCDAVNAQVTFNAYVGGVSYYAVRIKHFGDDLTPWTKGGSEQILTTAKAYGEGDQADKDYLGRYGVLRNNWYELNINAISKYGEPLVKNLPLDGTSDDNNDPNQAISCKINILSWAKRSQDVVLD